nr:MAG TPA: hypothetical protein [Crassvirales sp.]
MTQFIDTQVLSDFKNCAYCNFLTSYRRKSCTYSNFL